MTFTHPLLSVTVTEALPAVILFIICVVCPFDQLYVYGGVPVKLVTSANPLLNVLHGDAPVTTTS